MALAERYDRFYAAEPKHKCENIALSGWPRNRQEAIVAVPGSGDTLVDVGCGDGYLLSQFRHRFAELVGLELSPARLNRASENLAGARFRPILGTAEDMREIASESVDRMISADTIEHIPDVYAAAAEMYRVIKRGGMLVINTPNIAYIKRRALLLCGRFPSTSQSNEGLGSDILFDGGHLHYFTYRSLSLVLRKAGFQVGGGIGYGRFGCLHRFWPSLMSVGVQLVATKP
jgi:SAM-dependent methyltransferase